MKSKVCKILIAFTAIVFSLTMQFSVGAGALNILEDNVNKDLLQDLIDKVLNQNQTTTETTTAQNDETTTLSGDETTTQDPVNSSGTGTLTTTTEPSTQGNQNNYYPNYNYNPNYNNTTPTTEPAGDEIESFSYESSLNELLESDSAAIIVQTPSENFTIGGLVVNDGNDDDGFTWQKAVLVAVAVLFVVLAALVAALLIQRSKKPEEIYIDTSRDDDSDIPDGPVAVEIMTQERIAELLGTASGKGARYTVADSASAIKTAALMGQLDSYSDPLLRKYTDEPVRFSPVASIDPDGDVTAAQILEATASMLDDITGNEKYASDTSGMGIADEELDSILNDTEVRNCPECQSPIKSGDMFCHSCGAFVGE